MRLIDADALIEKIHNMPDTADKFSFEHLVMTYATTVDAEPVRHGHWEIDETDGSCTCECGLTMWANDLIDGDANYCPNCGADMRGGDNT